MSTIEERLDELCRIAVSRNIPVEATETYIAIAGQWNAAKKAIQREIDNCYAADHHGEWHCYVCDARQDNPESHTTEDCPVAQLQAALAEMEG